MDVWQGGEAVSDIVDRCVEIGMAHDPGTERDKELSAVMREARKRLPALFVKRGMRVIYAVAEGRYDHEFNGLALLQSEMSDPDAEQDSADAYQRGVRVLRRALMEQVSSGEHSESDESEDQPTDALFQGKVVAGDGLKKQDDFVAIGGYALASVVRDETLDELSRIANGTKILDAERECLHEIGNDRSLVLTLPSRGEIGEEGDASMTPASLMVRYGNVQTEGEKRLFGFASRVFRYVSLIRQLGYAGEADLYAERGEHSAVHAQDIPDRTSAVFYRANRFANEIDQAFVQALHHLKTLQKLEDRFGDAHRIEAIRYLVSPSRYKDAVEAVVLAARKKLSELYRTLEREASAS